MLRAIEQIRRMRGGAQSHLMRCSDGNYYVVKFQNNPQHKRILVNEMLATRIASRIGLPTTPVEVIEVSANLIHLTPDLCIEFPRSRTPCSPGLQFGSRFPGDPRRITLHDFLPDDHLTKVVNLHDFAGMLVFDKFACNTNGRQTVFFPEAVPRESGLIPGSGTDVTSYQTVMIDQGFCFNAGEWNFPDAPLRGLYARNRVYAGVRGLESFAPWLERLEKRITEKVLAELVQEIPPEWYEDDYDSVLALVEKLHRRRTRVTELIIAAKCSSRQPFPCWA